MKKDIIETKIICDLCLPDAVEAYYKCRQCGEDMCYDCMKGNGVEYKEGVHFSGGFDGEYCVKCDRGLRGKDNKIYNAYRKIADLRAEESAWHKEFDARRYKAEEELKALLRGETA